MSHQTANAQAADSMVVGSFVISVSQDEFEGTETVYAVNAGEEGGDDVVLAWMCARGRLRVILLHKYLGGDTDDRIRGQYKLDDAPPTRAEYWDLISSGRGTLLPERTSNAFTEAARNATRAMMRIVDPLDGETLTATYNLDGFTEAVSRLQCGT